MKQKSRKIRNRILSWIVVFAMMITMIPVANMGKVEVNAATKTLYEQDILNYFRNNQIVGHKTNFGNGCMAWCNTVYRQVFGVDTSKIVCCAPYTAEVNPYHLNISKDKNAIPIGAYVFFGGPKKQSTYCRKLNKPAGHTVIYVGNNEVVGVRGSGTVTLDTISYWEKSGYPFLGWTLPPGVNIVSGEGGTTVPSSIYITGQIHPTGNLPLGKSSPIRGTIYSNYNLTNVTAAIYDSGNQIARRNDNGSQIVVSVSPNKTSYNLLGAVNNGMIFNKLNSGSYRYVLCATDAKGKTVELINSPFSVGTVCVPNIYSNSVIGGVKVSMSADNGTIYYTTDGSNPTAGSNRYTGEFVLNHSAVIKAIAVNNGASGDIRTANITVGQLSNPQIGCSIDENALTISILADSGATVYYTTDGSNPSTSSPQYTGAFQVKDSVTVKALAVRSGSATSGIATDTFNVQSPATPIVKLSTGSKIAVGDSVAVTWNEQRIAYSYTAKLSMGDTVLEEQTVKGTSCAFTLPEVGDYTITVKANNFKGTSAESYPAVEVSAMNPLSVTFVDFDDTVISTQQVRYGYKAELPQKNPTRRGYDFKKWDNNAVYSEVKKDITAKAEYSKKRYIVKFEDGSGSALAPQQEVLFEDGVKLPADPTIDRDGYAFMGWRCISKDENSALDYEKVDANMTLIPVFDWANKDLPIKLYIDSATQESANSYKVSVRMTHYENVDTKGRLLITLKTSNGKMVKTFVEEFTVLAGQTSHSIKDIELVCDQIATRVEISAVGTDGQKTEGTIAESVTAETTSYANTKYSEWSTTAPSAGAKGVETKKMYSYRDKHYTDSTASSLAGWTQYGSPYVWYGDWSGTQTTSSYPGSSDTLEVTGSTTYYNWHHYCNKYSGKWNVDSIPYGSSSVYHSTTTTYSMPALSMADKGNRQAYGGKGTGAPKCSYNFYAWWLDSTPTTYYYRTRSKTVTYHYYRWGVWSHYSDNSITPNADREVREQTYYRYLIPMETPSEGEDLSGEAYTQQGKLEKTDLNFSGKIANILVYKNTNNDPTENQLEYVGQTVIGEENSYDFSFIPKETPEQANSNYIISLALEGTTDLFNIGVIYAERPYYHVTFYDTDGKEIVSEEVQQGDSVEAPEAPEIEGYTFVGWDKDTTDIQADRAITAQYKANEYCVVYVDYDQNTIQMETLSHGTPLPNPTPDAIEGKEFLGWDKIIDGQETVTGNMILTATYDVQDFEVKFVDENGTAISTQTVEYGEAATAPKPISVKDRKFLGWSTDFAWWNVTADITVNPVLSYEESSSAPVYEIEDTYLGGLLSVTVPNGEKAYYAIDYEEEQDASEMPEEISEENQEEIAEGESIIGGDETVWSEYTEEILLTTDAVVHLKTMDDNKNDSEIIDIDYSYDEAENPYTKTAKIDMPRAIGGMGDYIEIPINIDVNPGLMGAGFTFKYDSEIFDEVTITTGEVFENGMFNENVLQEMGEVKILWSDVDQVTKTGTLFTVRLHVKTTVEEGDYSFDLEYSQEDTFDLNFQDVKVVINGSGDITVGDIVLGDVNGDDFINNKDVAFIARYLVGKNELTEKQKSVADVNSDGKINNKDVSKLARFLVGKEKSLGGN